MEPRHQVPLPEPSLDLGVIEPADRKRQLDDAESERVRAKIDRPALERGRLLRNPECGGQVLEGDDGLVRRGCSNLMWQSRFPIAISVSTRLAATTCWKSDSVSSRATTASLSWTKLPVAGSRTYCTSSTI